MDKSLRVFTVVCGLAFSHVACATPKDTPANVMTSGTTINAQVVLGQDAKGQPTYMIQTDSGLIPVRAGFFEDVFEELVKEAEEIMCGKSSVVLPSSFSINAAVVSATYDRKQFCDAMKEGR